MSRPIAYNASGPLSGSIRGGSVNYTVDSGNRDYTTFASKKWVPSADGVAPIVFVTDSYTQGITNQETAVPLFYSCNGTGSAAIIYTANRVPGSPGNYSDANVALNDLITARGYFILESNDPYQGDFQNGNLLDLDASKMSSYPQTGTNWYDLSGNDFDFSLVNGPSFQSSGWFNIDGADDAIILTGNSTLKSTNTLVVWLRTTDTTGLLLTGEPLNSTGPYYVAAYYPGQGFYNNNAGSPSYFIDTLSTSNPATPINYIDGRFHMWEVKELDFSNWTTVWNFFNYQAGFQIAGDVAKIQMFNSYLTAAQSKQLYFGSPIVTDGLVFAVDANNIVSYPKSGTAWYNLTGSVASATLFNSPIFTLPNGGAIDFDGTDDFATTPSTTISGDQTFCAWGVVEGPPNSPAGVITQHDYASTANFGINYVQNSGYRFGASIGYTNGDREYDTKVTNYLIQEGVIWNIVLVYSSSNNTIYWYVNGQLDNTYALSATPKSTNWPIGLGRWDPSYPAYYFTGKIFNSKIYNRALTAAEIQQNYQAEQYRFETPAGPVTNGLLLYWDAGNLDSYPGTGTTIYDLSGNGNNGTLVNGVGYNQTNGGVLTFDGVDDRVRISQNNIFYNNAFTWEFWIKFDAFPNTYSGIVWAEGVTGGGSGLQYLLSIQDNSGTRFFHYRIYNTSTGWASTDTSTINFIPTNWTHVVWTFNNGTTNIYTQGSLFHTDTSRGSYNGGTDSPVFLAGRNDAFASLDGEYGIANFYNKALSATEITQNYNAQKTRFGL
jgi:hypothetical protein